MSFLFDPSQFLFDAFGRARVSNPTTLFDSQQLVDNLPLIFSDVQVSGAGTSSTYNTNQSSSTLAVANATAGQRVRQTFRYFNYQPGKGQLVYMTCVLAPQGHQAGITRRVGYFDPQNGIFLESNGSLAVGQQLAWAVRSFTSGAPVDNRVGQADWNVDRLDGTGPSKITFDVTKAQIMFIDFEWLGVGRVRTGFVIDGQHVITHEFNTANIGSLVYMSSPNLPIRYEITNSGAGPVASLVTICATVISQGGSELTGTLRAVDRGVTLLDGLALATIYPLLAIRLKTTHKAASVTPQRISIICPTNASFRWALLLNPTVVGTALSFSPLSNSAVEADVATTAATTLTGGVQLESGYVAGNGAGSNPAVQERLIGNLQIGFTAAAVPVADILVVAVQRIDGGAGDDFYGSLSWIEAI